jgi:predicted PhzF superfamily epimerase YddE/YHI9
MHHGETAATLNFHTRSGVLRVTRDDSGLMEMDFPSQAPTPAADTRVFETMLGFLPQDCLTAGRYAFAVLSSEADIGALDYDRINFQAAEDGGLLAALIATAPAKSTSEVDCVTRFFAPYAGIPEDPVTGSIHTSVVPYWSKRLGKKDVVAYQASKRGGLLHCTDLGDRVLLRGRCADYMEAIVSLP